MKLVVAAGHGGTDPGNTWGGTTEAALMVELRHLVALKLRQAGHEVLEDGGRDVNLPLARAMALVPQADVAVELHTNAAANSAAAGVEVVAAPKDAELARRLARAIGGVLQVPVRRLQGWYPVDDLARERGFRPGFVRAGGLIVEVFFQSNPAELRAYQERKWLVASAMARALVPALEVA